MGGLSILGGGLFEWIIWLANPLYFLSVITFFNKKGQAKVLSLVSTIVALSFLGWKKILVSESGRLGEIDSLDLGYWLWTLSLMTATIGMFLPKINIEKLKHYA